MTVNEEQVEQLAAYCSAELGDKDLWRVPTGYPGSLALCIIDAIYSTGSHYTSVINTVTRYRQARGDDDGVEALLASIDAAGGSTAWASDVVDNRKPAHTKAGAVLKAEVVRQAAEMLRELGIDTVPDLLAALGDDPRVSEVHARWKQLPSQRSGVTFNYFLILAGLPSVKPDRMVLRFLDDALDGAELSRADAVDLISATAVRMGVDVRALDHMIWRFASGRVDPT